MFHEVEFSGYVGICAEHLDGNGLVSRQSIIITRILEYLSVMKSSKDHGYFLAVSNLKSIGKGEVVDKSGSIFFHVAFYCRTFMPMRGEILQGVVHHIGKSGAMLRCGPIKYAYLSGRKMPNYQYVSGLNPLFLSDELDRIEIDVVVRFQVLDVKWVENTADLRRDFIMLASIEGDSLGPVSLCGSDEMDL